MSDPSTHRTCPTCGARLDWKATSSRPFCSDRCKLVDLGAWASGRYGIPGERIDREKGEEKENEVAGEGEECPPTGGRARSGPSGDD